MTFQELNQLSKEIFQGNLEAGWWTDLKTGKSIVQTRSRPEILALMHSEVSEAWTGKMFDLFDDKIPTMPMFIVELADTAIRGLDLMGAENIEYSLDDFYPELQEVSDEKYLLNLHLYISDSLEGLRKSKTKDYHDNLKRCVHSILCGKYSKEVKKALTLKLAYNKVREDHKIMNRNIEGGKKF